MFYYLYEIRNNLNGKIYVGVHKTKSLDDGYMGSGKIIRSAIEKHGIANFSKVILETFDTSDAMYAREKEIVTDEFLARDDVYNLRRGGSGGFDYINKDPEKYLDVRRSNIANVDRSAGGRTTGRLNANKWKSNPGSHPGIFGKEFNIEMNKRSQSESAQLKRRVTLQRKSHQKGSSNSQFGTMWITNGSLNRKVNKSSPIEDGWERGRTTGW